MPSPLPREARLHIMKFACSFAWADLEVRDLERSFIQRLMKRLDLEDDAALVEEWLRAPPPPEEVDPTRVPPEHRALVLEAARELVEADGHFDSNERELFELLEQLMGAEAE